MSDLTVAFLALPTFLVAIVGFLNYLQMRRLQPHQTANIDADRYKTNAETVTIQNSTIAGMTLQISSQNGVIFELQTKQFGQTTEIASLKAEIIALKAEIKRRDDLAREASSTEQTKANTASIVANTAAAVQAGIDHAANVEAPKAELTPPDPDPPDKPIE